MLIAPPQLAPGQRELAILVDAETGVAGKIGPDSIVDVIATYPGGDTKARTRKNKKLRGRVRHDD